MENNPSYSCIQSQKCIYCAEKDQMLRKYEKLVQLLKKRAKRCSAISVNTFQSSSSQFGVRQLADELMSSRNSNNNSLNQSEDNKQNRGDKPPDAIGNIAQKYKIKEEIQIHADKLRKSIPNLFSLTSPSAFNRSQTETVPKRISLSSQWQQRFHKLSQVIEKKQQRIENLINQIYSIKNQQLYIRQIMKNLLKCLSIKDPQKIPHKLYVSNKSKDIIKLLLHIFEYSEQEMQAICGGDCENISKIIKKKDSLKTENHNDNKIQENYIDFRDFCVPLQVNGIRIQQIR